MKLAHDLREVEWNNDSVVTVGSFDGVHRAHRCILDEVVHRARSFGGRSVVVTFDPHPREVVGKNPGQVQLLTTLQERVEAFSEASVDLVLVVRFDFEFSRQSSTEFIKAYLVDGTGLKVMVEGFDHHFGRDREGSVEELSRIGQGFGFEVVSVPKVEEDGVTVSSSAIRSLLLDGSVERAGRLLGRPYEATGTVVAGDGRGKELGYPTANLRLESEKKLLPRNGIYFVRVEVEGKLHFGLASIGLRPTFYEDGLRTFEVYLLEFNGNLYDRSVRVRFLKRMRDEKKFDGADQLIRQMDADRAEGLGLREAFRMNPENSGSPHHVTEKG